MEKFRSPRISKFGHSTCHVINSHTCDNSSSSDFSTGKHTYLTKNSLLDGRSSPECYPIKYIVQQVGKRLKAVESGKDLKGWEKVP